LKYEKHPVPCIFFLFLVSCSEPVQYLCNPECETPMEYLIQSNCPFGTVCLENGCAVVCPIGNYEQEDVVDSSCKRDSDCDCSWRGNRTLDCKCVENACVSVEEYI
jgi:hypothetical protein